MAGGWGTTFANDLIRLIFLATAIANIADNAASSPLTSIYLSTHTASPTGGNQTTSESAYTSYARTALLRSATGFTQSGATMSLTSLTSMPAATGGTETITHFQLGTAISGAGKTLVWGTVTPSIAVANGVTPQLTTATLLTLGV
jgi:hypothetical protein